MEIKINNKYFAVIRTKITEKYFSIAYSIYAMENTGSAIYSYGTNCYRKEEGFEALTDIINEIYIDFGMLE